MTQRVRFASLAIVSALGITVLAASRLEPPVPGMTFANEHGTSSFGVEDEGYPIETGTTDDNGYAKLKAKAEGS